MELQHHGVKGMRWGVRRYRKPDGSLTPAGKKRYSDSEETKESKKKLTTSQKVAIGAGVGVAVAATALAVYGGIKYKDFVKQVATKQVRERADRMIFVKDKSLDRDTRHDIEYKTWQIRKHLAETHLSNMKFSELNEIAKPVIDAQRFEIKKAKNWNAHVNRDARKRIAKSVKEYVLTQPGDVVTSFKEKPWQVKSNYAYYKNLRDSEKSILGMSLKTAKERRYRVVPKMRDILK